MTSLSSACVSDLASALAYKIKALSYSPQEVRVCNVLDAERFFVCIVWMLAAIPMPAHFVNWLTKFCF